MTQPTGTSPRAPAARASSSAIAMKEVMVPCGPLCYQPSSTSRTMNGNIEQHKPGERIAKVIARAGLASRREAEAWIAAGRVAVNGEGVPSPARNVTGSDRLSVGRLDINTEGLLLLTNDGGLARVLELPETGWLRRYRVRALGRVTQAQLDALREGVTVDGIRYGPIEATLDRDQGSNVWVTFAIREGKNREVRNVLRHLGLQVNRLIRVSFGPFQLREIAEGAVDEVRTRVLREQLGERI